MVVAEDICNAVPKALAADAVTFTITVSSFAADANSESIVETPVAPVWLTKSILPVLVAAVEASEMLKSIPSVLVVPEAAITTAFPVVMAANPPMSNTVPVVNAAADKSTNVPNANAAEAVTLKTTVSSVAAEANSDKMPDVEVVPVWSTLNNLPAPVIAVAEEVITAPIPEVNPFPFTLNNPAAVVAEFAVNVNRFPVKVIIPVEMIDIAVPVVWIVSTVTSDPANWPEAVMSSIVPSPAEPVFTPEEVNLTNEPVVMTEVAWAMLIAVPSVRAAKSVQETAEPVVKAAPKIPTKVPVVTEAVDNFKA